MSACLVRFPPHPSLALLLLAPFPPYQACVSDPWARSVQQRAGYPWHHSHLTRRLSVIRGLVVSTDGQDIVGVGTSVDKQNNYGLMDTCKDGW